MLAETESWALLHKGRRHPARGPTESAKTEAKDIDDDSQITQSCQGPDNIIFYPIWVTTHRHDSTAVSMHFPPLATRTTLPPATSKSAKQMWWFVEAGRRNKQEYKMWILSSNIHCRMEPIFFKLWRFSYTIYYAHLLCHISVVFLIFLILKDLFTQQLSSTELQYYCHVLPINISSKIISRCKVFPT